MCELAVNHHVLALQIEVRNANRMDVSNAFTQLREENPSFALCESQPERVSLGQTSLKIEIAGLFQENVEATRSVHGLD